MKQIKWFYSYDIFILLYLFIGIILERIFLFDINYGTLFNFKYDIKMAILLFLFLLIVAIFVAFKKFINKEDRYIFGRTWRKAMLKDYFSFQHIYDFIRVTISLKLVLMIYCNIKQAIPRMNSYIADSTLLEIDKILHFGVNPIKLIVDVLGSSSVISILMDKLYVFWYIIKMPVLVLFILLPQRKLSERFFGAYFLLWIFGGLFAVVAPSLGPVYVYREWFDGVAKPIASQLQYQLISHYVQAINNPDQYSAFIYEGVAAFPSLHVGVVVLFALFLSQVKPWLGYLMGVYAIIIQLGSVFLGWHYAVDGYFASILAFLLYRLVMKDWFDKLTINFKK